MTKYLKDNSKQNNGNIKKKEFDLNAIFKNKKTIQNGIPFRKPFNNINNQILNKNKKPIKAL